jgi:hypothetical protein
VGSGGAGLTLSAGGTVVNAGSISGGGGGGNSGSASGIAAGGTGSGGASGFKPNVSFEGVGGVGIVGAGLTVINSGTISGGASLFGQANAITFTGGTNTLQLQAGSSITGNVVGTGSDTLQLGGSTNANFDISQVASSGQYQGFASFQKLGTSTWTHDRQRRCAGCRQRRRVQCNQRDDHQ